MLLSHWLSTCYTIEFMGICERVNNSDFNVTEFRYIRTKAGATGMFFPQNNGFKKTNAIGIISKAGIVHIKNLIMVQ